MTTFIESIRLLSRLLNWAACLAMGAMMLLTCADVTGRLAARPILGAYEVVGFLMAFLVGFGMGQSTIDRGHVSVQLIAEKLPLPWRKAVYVAISFLSGSLFALIAVELIRMGNDFRIAGEVSLTLHLPTYWILYGVGLSAGVVSVICFVDAYAVISGREEPWYRWER
jgi:TRAP-type C4-dicarboxylate transport system permease small subunit